MTQTQILGDNLTAVVELGKDEGEVLNSNIVNQFDGKTKISCTGKALQPQKQKMFL